MFLILSGQYVGADLQAEFGQLPPALLPVGNRRLFLHQAKLIPESEKAVLTLPQYFKLDSYDQTLINELDIDILPVPERLNLGEAIVYAVNMLELPPNETLYILHGDTLFRSVPNTPDVIGFSSVKNNYNWAALNTDSEQLLEPADIHSGDAELTVSVGYFSFSKPNTLVRALTECNWDFMCGINRYHELIGLEPVAMDDWLDFGHLLTYYDSKTRKTTEREFNQLQIGNGIVKKTSRNDDKLRAEANWYQSIPGRLRAFTPHFLWEQESENEFEYAIEYLHLTALNELFVFSRLPPYAWRVILDACLSFVSQNAKFQNANWCDASSLNALFKDKTDARLALFAEETGTSLDKPWQFNQQTMPSLNELAAIATRYIPESSKTQQVIHGDFCFSNILYDFRTSSIKVIDPRGINQQKQQTIYGDFHYDIAKLAHSVCGGYDLIIAGYYKMNQEAYQLDFKLPSHKHLDLLSGMLFEKTEALFGIKPVALIAMQIHLFLSMLPLHRDDPQRQMAFIANAFRLYLLLQQEKDS